jgi:RHS repeat-associated protein
MCPRPDYWPKDAKTHIERAAADGLVTLVRITPDPLGTGNMIRVEQPSTSRCSDLAYDPLYAQLITASTTYTHGCSSSGLSTTFHNYARGLGLVMSSSTSDGAATQVQYEPYGRPRSIYRPDPAIPGAVETIAGATFDYGDNSVPRKVHTTLYDGTATHDFWAVLDGYGRALLSAAPADTSAGDAKAWIVSGQASRNAKGWASKAYPPSFQADWTTAPLAPTSGPARTVQYDAFGRVTGTTDLDGTQDLKRTYGALASTTQDAEQLKPAGASAPHAGLMSAVVLDGHGRTQIAQSLGNGGVVMDQFTYLPTGELWVIDRRGTDAKGVQHNYERWMQYDSLGRMVVNAEPSATTGFVAADKAAGPTPVPSSLHTWTYAYDDAGDLVGTTDARGCGKNVTYDGAGRPTGEDYFGCTPTQLPYSPPNMTTGVGLEVSYQYDSSGHLSDLYDRGAHSHYVYDARSRMTSVQRNIVQPGKVPSPWGGGYAGHTFEQDVQYDDIDRIVTETTGEEASVPDLVGTAVPFGANKSPSALVLHYSQRGVLSSVGGSYGTLVRQRVLDADGLPLETSLGDIASPPSGSQWGSVPGTQTTYSYDSRRRLQEVKTARVAPAAWTTPSGNYSPPPFSPVTTTQTVLADDTYAYDAVGNPTGIGDFGRIPGEWPATAQPVSRGPLVYDDFYRLKSANYAYANKEATYQSPSPAPTPAADPFPLQTPGTRIGQETFDYDPLGNPRTTTDDASLFFDRSLGATNIGSLADPTSGAVLSTNQILSSSMTTASGLGYLTASYDAAGNLEQLAVVRTGACASTDGCSQLFQYEWDEVGHLAHAQRFDFTPAPKCSGRFCPQFVSPKNGDPTTFVYPEVPPFAPGADVTFAYDGKGARTVRASNHSDGTATYTVEIFPSLRLNDTTFGTQDAVDYDRSAATDGVYLVAGNSSLGRVVYAEGDPGNPAAGALAGQHVFLELADPLGSTSMVIDQATSELVERTTYSSYGRVESDYWPSRWQEFREPYKFTGKEDDVSLGITYFGARYYSPYLETWMSPDPLAIHGVSGDLNPYAYVHGRVTAVTDPTGLDGSGCLGQEDCGANADSGPNWFDIASWPGDFSRAWGSIFHHGSSARPPPLPVNPGSSVLFTPIMAKAWPRGDLAGGEADYFGPRFDDILSQRGPIVSALGMSPEHQQALAEDYDNLLRHLYYNGGIQQLPMLQDTVVFGGPALVEGLAAEASSSSYVYQLVDQGGDAVYYGITNNPLVRLGAHSRLPPGPFSGMQVISDALPLPQAQALETSLIQGAGAQGRLIYNVAESSVPRAAPLLDVPPTVSPTQTLLNPKLY